MASDGLFIEGGTIYRSTFFRGLQTKYIGISYNINDLKAFLQNIVCQIVKVVYQRFVVDIFKDFFVRRKKERSRKVQPKFRQ